MADRIALSLPSDVERHLEAMKQIRATLESFPHPERIVILAGVLGTEVCEPKHSRAQALVFLSYANRIATDRMEQEFTPEDS